MAHDHQRTPAHTHGQKHTPTRRTTFNVVAQDHLEIRHTQTIHKTHTSLTLTRGMCARTHGICMTLGHKTSIIKHTPNHYNTPTTVHQQILGVRPYGPEPTSTLNTPTHQHTKTHSRTHKHAGMVRRQQFDLAFPCSVTPVGIVSCGSARVEPNQHAVFIRSYDCGIPPLGRYTPR